MEPGRPRGDHEEVFRASPIRFGEVAAHLCAMVSIPSALLIPAAADDLTRASIVITVIACVGYFAGYYLMTWYFWILLRRMRRLAAPPSEAAVWQPPVRSGTGPTREPPEICFRRPVFTQDPAAPYDGPPLNITYFRCFANSARTRTFLEGAWKEFGHVHLLRDPSSTTWRERWRSRTPEKMAELVVSTEGQLLDRLQHAPAEHSVREFFCGDAFWQQAAYRLIVMADLVVIDLSGLTPESLGLQFELEQAFATKRSDQVVVLADNWSDQDYLAGLVRQAWTGSPGGPSVVNAYIVDKLVSKLVTVPGPSVPGGLPSFGREITLRSDREESRRLLRSILASQES